MSPWNPCSGCGCDSYERWVALRGVSRLCYRCRVREQVRKTVRLALQGTWWCPLCEQELTTASGRRRHEFSSLHRLLVRTFAKAATASSHPLGVTCDLTLQPPRGGLHSLPTRPTLEAG